MSGFQITKTYWSGKNDTETKIVETPEDAINEITFDGLFVPYIENGIMIIRISGSPPQELKTVEEALEAINQGKRVGVYQHQQGEHYMPFSNVLCYSASPIK